MYYSVIAHRGASTEAPENTISAIKRAIELKVDFIEFDVHLSKDGIPIVIHDASLKRTTDADDETLVIDSDLYELKNYDAGTWFSEKFAGEKIPTLSDVLELDKNGCGLMIEIKGEQNPPKEIVRAIVKEIVKTPQKDPVIIGSFSIDIIRELQNQIPFLPLIAIADEEKELANLKNLDVKYFAICEKMINPELVDELHQKGCIVWTFTIDDLIDAERVSESHVDGIITNNPRKLLLPSHSISKK